jgi:hypothetical protein
VKVILKWVVGKWVLVKRFGRITTFILAVLLLKERESFTLKLLSRD